MSAITRSAGRRPPKTRSATTGKLVSCISAPPNTPGTRLTALINGPHGALPSDPPTITGEVFDEDGHFVNSFMIRTDEWVVELDVLQDLVWPGGPAFGTVRMNFCTTDRGAVVFERHTAFGRFSVGSVAFCRTP